MTITLNGSNITINDLVAIARSQNQVALTTDKDILARLQRSQDLVEAITTHQQLVYGINTNFGGLSDQAIAAKDEKYLQENLIWGLASGTGNPLPEDAVRAAMALRINALLNGASGIRFLLLERYVKLLNEKITPVVYEYGSIGASGDLVPLAHIAGAAVGYSNQFKVKFKNKIIGSQDALAALNLQPITLNAKEGLALVNGTAVLTGIAALCHYDFSKLFNYTLKLHALFAHAMEADIFAFAPYVQQLKPHPGQTAVAQQLWSLLNSSSFVRHGEKSENDGNVQERLTQDRYSLRCLPQFLGPIAEGITTIAKQIEIEANAVTDNPLIDPDLQQFYHAGNFLGQHMAIAMDQLRNYLALMCKHLDSQIAMIVTPAFNHGLPAALAAPDARIHYGLDGLQICANSIMPRILLLAQPIAPLFPTHAETYNQNINSQGFNAANLARDSICMYQHYLAIATIFAIQAVELRTFSRHQHYAAEAYLPKTLQQHYHNVYEILNRKPSSKRPLILNNVEQLNSDYISLITDELRATDSSLLD